jgi:hypothetical protein
VSYRDDVDTLYTRAMILQRELDAAKDKLLARDEELAQLRGTPRKREDTSPGMAALRVLPDPREALDRLVDTTRDEKPGRDKLEMPPLPMPDWSKITSTPMTYAAPTYVEHARDRLAHLLPGDLVLITKIITELTDDRPGMDDKIRARLHWLASEIALDQK